MINWHNETLKKMKSLSDDSLKFIRIDAYHAYKAFDDLDNKGNHLNPKADQYLDEFYYACQELKKRGFVTINLPLK